jgi:ABC-2 type transport system permease protein
MKNKTVLMFKHEFRLTVKRAGYIIMTLAVPVLTLLAIGIHELVTSFSASPGYTITYIGYVDEPGIIHEIPDQEYVKFTPFASREDATRALTDMKISTYVVIPGDYLSSGRLHRFTLEKENGTPPAMASAIWRFLSVNLLKDQVDPEVASLVVSPLNMNVTRITPQGEESLQQKSFANVIIPGVFALLLSLALMFGASSLVSSLGEEKESRLIEVLFSSVSVRQLLVSKVLALGLAGLLQVLVWLITSPLLLQLASSSFGGVLNEIEIPVNFILLGTIYFILGYLLFAVLSIGIGAVTPSAREGNQLSMFYIMMGFVPLWFSSLLFAFPNGSAWVVFTLFPVTAPVQTMLRLGVTEIPLWQILVSIGLLILTIAAGLIFSIKIFRVFMLIHGKRPGLKTIFQHLKSA